MKIFPLSRGDSGCEGNREEDGPGYPGRLCRHTIEGRFRRKANHVGLAGAPNDGNSASEATLSAVRCGKSTAHKRRSPYVPRLDFGGVR
jgi:hypothetical protein